MTAGQLLVSLSGLSGVSAGAHLMAITAGPGATVFASAFTVLVEEPKLRVLLNENEEAALTHAYTVEFTATDKELKRLFIETAPNEVVVSTADALLTVVEVKA